MAVPLVNPVSIPYGDMTHLTPTDQNNDPIPIDQCTLLNLPPSTATWEKDVTGFVLTAVGIGSYSGVQIQWSDGVNYPIRSLTFTVTVLPPDAAVTEVGDTQP